MKGKDHILPNQNSIVASRARELAKRCQKDQELS
jgi:hypothetical protein